MRKFETGATRDADDSKFDYEGFLSPTVLEAYADYMHTNRFQSDGTIRDGDNWQKGIPLDAYMKSMFRHFMAVWKGHRNGDVKTDELAALMFNVMGYMHEKLKLDSKVITRQMIVESLAYASPRARQNAWDNIEESPDHYTHRYGALAHDAEAIAEETSEDPEDNKEITHNEAGDFTLIYRKGILYPHNEGYEGDVRSVAGVDGGKVVGVSEKRAQEQVEPLAPEVQSAGRCEAPICGCKW